MRGPETIFGLAQNILAKNLVIVGEPARIVTPNGVSLTLPRFSIHEPSEAGVNYLGTLLVRSAGTTTRYAFAGAVAEYHKDHSLKLLPLSENSEGLPEVMQRMHEWIMYRGNMRIRDSGFATLVELQKMRLTKQRPGDENFMKVYDGGREPFNGANIHEALQSGFPHDLGVDDRFKTGSAKSWLDPRGDQLERPQRKEIPSRSKTSNERAKTCRNKSCP